MTDRLIVRRGYLILHTCMYFNSIICVISLKKQVCFYHALYMYVFCMTIFTHPFRITEINYFLFCHVKKESLCIVVSNTYCSVLFFFYLLDSVLCPYVVSFSGLSIFVLPLRYSLTFI
jgi:hypothetical protein